MKNFNAKKLSNQSLKNIKGEAGRVVAALAFAVPLSVGIGGAAASHFMPR